MRAELQPVPPKLPARLSSGLSPRLFIGVLLGATAVGAGAMVFFFNPSTHGFYPVCMFHQLTGWNCPGCGMTRGLYALLHGNVRLALKDNALLVLALVGLAFWGGQFIVRKFRQQPARFYISPKLVIAFGILAVVFGVLRNLPGFSWLAP
jgi:hypothetical protein